MRQRCGHCIAVGLVLQIAVSVWAQPPGQQGLRARIEDAVRQGEIPAAVTAVQEALAAAPDDPGVKVEFIDLHLSLARVWVEAGHFRSAMAALAAVQQVAPDQHETIRMQREIQLRREALARHLDEVDRLLEYQRYFDAHATLGRIAAHAGDQAVDLHRRLAVALLGMGDQYLLADAPLEAWRCYEQHLAGVDRAPLRWIRRWALSLGLATARDPHALPPGVRDIVRPRLGNWSEALAEHHLGDLVHGFLDHADGRPIDAGRAWSRALGRTWGSPPAARRGAVVAALERAARKQLDARVRELELTSLPGAWRVVLLDTWKHRETRLFQARARNDVVADFVVRAAAYHHEHLATWLGLKPPLDWQPRCELEIHADLAALHKATGTSGATRAVTHTKVQGRTVVSRKIHLYQSDEWLLASTLPHELTHVLVQTLAPEGIPLAVDEGLALQTEPPPRRQQFLRERPAEVSPLNILLTAVATPDPPAPFYADSLDVVNFLLERATANVPDQNPRRTLIAAFQREHWYEALGWSDLAAAEGDWQAYAGALRTRETVRASVP